MRRKVNTPMAFLLAGSFLSLFLSWQAHVARQAKRAPGRVVALQVNSQALGGVRTVNVYLPGAHEKTDDRFPVVYLLRGHEREWLNPAEDPHRQGRTAATIADRLIRDGQIPPVILVMPPTTSADGQVHGLGIEMLAPELGAGVGPGRFESFLIREVVPAVDAQYRTIPDRTARALDGFSLGGFTALSLALRHPDLFASVGAFDGSYFYAGGVRPDGSPDLLLEHALFAPAFGTPRSLAHLRQYNPADLIQTLRETDLKRLSFHLQSAPEALEPGESNFYRTRYILQLLKRRGVVNSFEPATLDSSRHNWYWADEHLKRSLVKHASVFTAK